MDYKYRIHYLLRQLSFDDYQIAMKWLPERLGISLSTWKRYIYLPADSKLDLSFVHLQQLASFFECDIQALHTNPLQWNLLKEFIAIVEQSTPGHV